MRNKLSKFAHILLILLIGGIGFQTTIFCSSGSDDNGGGSGGSLSSGSGNSVNNDGYFKYYDSDDEKQRCQNGVVQGKCGDVWYDMETHFCLTSSSSTVLEICGDNTISNRTSNIVFFGITAPLSRLPARCQDGHFELECGGVWFNYNTHICQDGNLKTYKEYYESSGLVSCSNSSSNDGSWYNPANENSRCNNGTAEIKCGDVWYNSSTHTCKDGTVEANTIYLTCGSGNYIDYYQSDSNSTRCKDGIVEFKCGDVWYNINTHTCKDGSGKARTRCGS